MSPPRCPAGAWPGGSGAQKGATGLHQRWGHGDIHGRKNELNGRALFRPGAEFLKTPILVAAAQGFSSRPPETIS